MLTTSTNIVAGTRYYALPGGSVIRTGTNYTFTLADGLGTPVLYLDSTAQKPSWRQYSAYGEDRGVGISLPDNRSFLNKTLNLTTGLIQMGARQYDATIGRFISVDPLQDLNDPQQWNGYAYAGNDPISHSDPSGLSELGRDDRGYGKGGTVVKPPKDDNNPGNGGGTCGSANACEARPTEACTSSNGCEQRGEGKVTAKRVVLKKIYTPEVYAPCQVSPYACIVAQENLDAGLDPTLVEASMLCGYYEPGLNLGLGGCMKAAGYYQGWTDPEMTQGAIGGGVGAGLVRVALARSPMARMRA